jgi:hypothetical protein
VYAECTCLNASSEAAGRVFDKLEIRRVSDIEGADEILREEMIDVLVETLFNIELVEVERGWKPQQSIVNEVFIFVG